MSRGVEVSGFGAKLARMGFDRARLRFSIRTALAAFAALVIALWLGLEHPQWAAMTVFASAQPTRDQLFQKSMNRLLGTLAGTAVGLGLLYAAGSSIWTLAIGLSLWVAICTGLANLIRGFGSYGLVLMGYSAAMVALLGQVDPSHPIALGLDRFLTSLVGVVIGILVGWLGAKNLSDDRALGVTRRLLADILVAKVQRLGDQPPASADHLLSRAAILEDSLDPRSADAPRSANTRLILRQLLASMAELILILDRCDEERPVEVASHLQAAAETMIAQSLIAAGLPALKAAREATTSPDLARVLDTLMTDIRRRDEASFVPLPHVIEEAALPQHRNWPEAQRAAIRTFLVLMILGGFWAITGWPEGSLLMLGTSVMISVFSIFDNPAWIMIRVFMGQLGGAIAAIFCAWVLWPMAHNSWQMAALMLPLLMITPFLFAHRKTAPGAVDFAMVFLLLTQPIFPFDQTFDASITRALAVVSGPLFAYLGFRAI